MLLFILPAIKGIQHLINNNFEDMWLFPLDGKVLCVNLRRCLLVGIYSTWWSKVIMGIKCVWVCARESGSHMCACISTWVSACTCLQMLWAQVYMWGVGCLWRPEDISCSSRCFLFCSDRVSHGLGIHKETRLASHLVPGIPLSLPPWSQETTRV